MASKLFHAVVVAGAAMAGTASLGGCYVSGLPSALGCDGGAACADIATGRPVIDGGGPWWPDIGVPLIDFSWYIIDILSANPDMSVIDLGWVIIDMGIPFPKG